MKANELRIGNWIKLSKKATVDENHFEVSQFRLGTFLLNNEQFDLLEGIPLNEEWFLNFGFEKQGRYLRLLNTKFTKRNTWRFEYGGWVTQINYVHQLQNLFFAITNEELTLKK